MKGTQIAKGRYLSSFWRQSVVRDVVILTSKWRQITSACYLAGVRSPDFAHTTRPSTCFSRRTGLIDIAKAENRRWRARVKAPGRKVADRLFRRIPCKRDGARVPRLRSGVRNEFADSTRPSLASHIPTCGCTARVVRICLIRLNAPFLVDTARSWADFYRCRLD